MSVKEPQKILRALGLLMLAAHLCAFTQIQPKSEFIDPIFWGAQRPKSSPLDSGEIASGLAKSTITTVVQFNKHSHEFMDPTFSTDPFLPCAECQRPKPTVAESCSAGAPNNYMQSALRKVLNSEAYSAFFNSPQKEVITSACIQRNMRNFDTRSSFFRQCAPGQLQNGRAVPRACISDDYLNVTSKSFNLVADCMGDYVAGEDDDDINQSSEVRRIHAENGKRQAALSVFAFMAQESGMHINAQSATGAGGPGQMTGPAIDSVNKDLKNIRAHLAGKSDPKCSNILTSALNKPFSQMAAACDRKSPENQIQAMAYAFGYQAYVRRYLENTVFDAGRRTNASRMFDHVVSLGLPRVERDRLMMEVSAWAHNTGQGGMERPLAALLTIYRQQQKKIASAADVDQFLKDLAPVVSQFNPRRANETGNYYKRIQEKLRTIAPGGRLSCLAN